ncbi:hypothetical protein OBBRIDRAFT_798516 [Obba rivulosa]|uniref:Uncharacterized protein n=1 Tax=Obba rivulosa TaxID=1052685 RepID=A0A8E2ANK2_9APHY|nr:hypothetical protein OBBRIDRAFT_798516 [Obba rivulosa]
MARQPLSRLNRPGRWYQQSSFAQILSPHCTPKLWLQSNMTVHVGPSALLDRRLGWHLLTFFAPMALRPKSARDLSVVFVGSDFVLQAFFAALRSVEIDIYLDHSKPTVRSGSRLPCHSLGHASAVHHDVRPSHSVLRGVHEPGHIHQHRTRLRIGSAACASDRG